MYIKPFKQRLYSIVVNKYGHEWCRQSYFTHYYYDWMWFNARKVVSGFRRRCVIVVLWLVDLKGNKTLDWMGSYDYLRLSFSHTHTYIRSVWLWNGEEKDLFFKEIGMGNRSVILVVEWIICGLPPRHGIPLSCQGHQANTSTPHNQHIRAHYI